MIKTYSDYIIRYHKFIAIASLFLVVFLSAGLPRLTFTNDFHVFFSEDNPQLKAFDRLEEIYGKQDSVTFYIEANEGTIFTKNALTLIYELTEESWDIPFADRVSSITNYQHTIASNDTLTTKYLLDDPESLDAVKVAYIQKIALTEPTLLNRFVGPTGVSTSITVRIEIPDNDKNAPNEVVEYAEDMLSKYRAQYPDVAISLAGSTTAGVNLGRAVQNDLSSLVIFSYALITLGLIVFLKSVRATFLVMIFITMAVLSTMGFFGWFNKTLTPVAGWVPSIVMTIAVADAVHILISYFHGLRRGMTREDAVHHSLRLNAAPVFITSLTTIVGVLCLNFSDSPPYRDLGNMVAIGVFMAYFFSMTFIPAIIAWLNMGKAHVNKGEYNLMSKLSEFVMANRRGLLIVLGMSTLVIVSFIPQNILTERWLEYYDETYEVRRTVEAINKNLSGVHAIRYEMHSGQEEGIFEPEYMHELESLADWYREQTGVVFVTNIAEIIKRLNKTYHNDDPAYYKIPETRAEIKQLYFLYEIGLPPELSLADSVNPDRSTSIFMAIFNKTHSAKILELENKASQWIDQNMTHIQVGEATGLDVMFSHLNKRNTTSLLQGTLIALILISFVLIIALKSVKLGLLSLIPNLAPAGLAYGTWALLVGEVDLSASVVICMSLGIVVDDTVHFLSKYLRAQREEGLDMMQAMHYAFNTVGMALLITTVVLVAGFLVLATSHFSPTWVTGLLMAMTLSYALLADFFLLPPLMVSLRRVLNIDKPTSGNSNL